MPLPNDIILNLNHFDKLACIRDQGCDWSAGRVPYDWAKSIGMSSAFVEQLFRKKMNRTELLSFCSDTELNVASSSILAWGGMKVDHGKRIASPTVWDKLMPIAKELKSGELPRKSAYEKLAKFRAENRGCGLGPAYYTKLIYFLDPKHDGYIMDQWTSLSVNLLFNRSGRPIVDLTTGKYKGRRTDTVSDRNSADDYETFCLCIDELAKKLGIQDPAQAEEWIFSNGGRHPAPWRLHVLANRHG